MPYYYEMVSSTKVYEKIRYSEDIHMYGILAQTLTSARHPIGALTTASPQRPSQPRNLPSRWPLTTPA